MNKPRMSPFTYALQHLLEVLENSVRYERKLKYTGWKGRNKTCSDDIIVYVENLRDREYLVLLKNHLSSQGAEPFCIPTSNK